MSSLSSLFLTLNKNHQPYFYNLFEHDLNLNGLKKQYSRQWEASLSANLLEKVNQLFVEVVNDQLETYCEQRIKNVCLKKNYTYIPKISVRSVLNKSCNVKFLENPISLRLNRFLNSPTFIDFLVKKVQSKTLKVQRDMLPITLKLIEKQSTSYAPKVHGDEIFFIKNRFLSIMKLEKILKSKETSEEYDLFVQMTHLKTEIYERIENKLQQLMDSFKIMQERYDREPSQVNLAKLSQSLAFAMNFMNSFSSAGWSLSEANKTERNHMMFLINQYKVTLQ